MFQNPRMRNMTKILDIRNEIIEIEARRVSSELLENRIGYRVLAGRWET